MAKIEVTPVSAGYNIAALNTTLQAIEDEFKNKVVYVDEISPMERDLDLNGFGLINVDTVNGTDVTALEDIGEYVDTALEAAVAAAASADSAEDSAIEAAANAVLVEDAKLVWRGPWSAVVAYEVNDAVSIDGRSYIAILESTNQTPPNLSYWDILADRGMDGAAGGGTGDASTNTASSVDNEIALFSGAAGKTLKRATGSGIVKIVSGVMATAIDGTDYIGPSSLIGFANGGTGEDNPVDAFDALKQAASDTESGVVELSTDAEFLTGTSDSLVPPVSVIRDGMINIRTVTPTTSGTTAVYEEIPSWAREINIFFDGFSTNGTSTPIVRARDAGGYEESGYSGSLANIGNAIATVGVLMSVGFAFESAMAPGAFIHGTMTLRRASLASDKWSAVFVGGRSDSSRGIVGGGTKTLSGPLTGIMVTTVGGVNTFDAGSVNISYS